MFYRSQSVTDATIACIKLIIKVKVPSLGSSMTNIHPTQIKQFIFNKQFLYRFLDLYTDIYFFALLRQEEPNSVLKFADMALFFNSVGLNPSTYPLDYRREFDKERNHF